MDHHGSQQQAALLSFDAPLFPTKLHFFIPSCSAPPSSPRALTQDHLLDAMKCHEFGNAINMLWRTSCYLMLFDA
jgi:hypothetical protein